MMTVDDVAARLKASESFVYAAVAEGRLKHYRLGKGQGCIRISEEQFAEFLRQTERGGEPAKEEAPKPLDDAPAAPPRAKGKKVELW
jgi:excisionase family DNA binding protein